VRNMLVLKVKAVIDDDRNLKDRVRDRKKFRSSFLFDLVPV
jgi:hypothetical protein